jgi:serine/threonine protein kinase
VRTAELIAGRYRLKEEVGSGGMGEVWRAVDEQGGREVALKRATRGADADSERTRRQLQREANNAAKLNHPNIVAFIDEATEGPERWLVMEYVPAQSLAHILHGAGPLDPQHVTHIGAQIASALAAVHAQGILHRDVTPGNILVTEDGTAKLTDFGISRSISDDVTADCGVVGGTVAFMASEVASGEDATRASDVFSLGATLFKAVEGTPPFGNADNPRRTLHQATAYKLLPFGRAGPLTPVLSALLQRDPAKRPDAAAAREMLQELATTLTGDGCPLSWPPGNPRRSWRPRRRAVAAGLCAVVVIALGIVMSLPDGAPITSSLSVPDPCGLTDTAALARFGATTRETARGNFNRCDVIVSSRNGSQVDVRVVLESRAAEGVTTKGAEPVHVYPNRQNGDSCVRTLLSGQNQFTNRVTITAKLEPGPPSGDLCAMAEAATAYAMTVLGKGAIPRRNAPFHSPSLAWVNACGLLDYGNLTQVLGDGLGAPEIGDWQCRWKSTTSTLSVAVFFDRNKLMSSIGGRPTTIGGREARIVPKADDPGPGNAKCDVWALNRSDRDAVGQPVIELLRVQVSGQDPPDQLCGPAQELSAAAVPKLPPR